MNTRDEDERQEAAWEEMYDRVSSVLRRFGKESPVGEGDYWVLDENWGPRQQKVCVFDLKILQPEVVYALQRSLVNHPDWGIVMAVDVPDKEGVWPPMGLIVRAHEIVDGLQRQFFPPEYQGLQYAGSRPGTDRD